MSKSKEIVLITGGTGFAGSHLAELLAASPDKYELHLTHVTPVPPELSTLLPTAHFHQVDLTNSQEVSQLLTEIKPTQIYQLASIPVVGDSFARASEILYANTAIVHNVLEGVKNTVPNARLLVITSAEVYGVSSDTELPISELHPLRPVNPYGVSKVTQDLLADCYRRSCNLQIIRIRPFNHIGERQPAGFAVADFAQQIVQIERDRATVLRVGDLSPQRDFTDVKDMVRGYQVVMEQGVIGEVYNLGSGITTSMRTIVDQLSALAQKPVAVEQDDARLRPVEIPVMQADIAKVKALGWHPEIPLSETLQRILGYWRGL